MLLVSHLEQVLMVPGKESGLSIERELHSKGIVDLVLQFQQDSHVFFGDIQHFLTPYSLFLRVFLLLFGKLFLLFVVEALWVFRVHLNFFGWTLGV